MKSKKISLRISESQFRRLMDNIVQEETTKSEYLRKLIENSDHICRKVDVNTNSKNKSRITLLDIIKRKKT